MWSFTNFVLNIDTSFELLAGRCFCYCFGSFYSLSVKVTFYYVMSLVVSKIKEFAKLCYCYRLFVWSWN